MRVIVGALVLALAPVGVAAQGYNAFGGYTSNQAGYGRGASAFPGFAAGSKGRVQLFDGLAAEAYAFDPPRYAYGRGWGRTFGWAESDHRSAGSRGLAYPGYGGAYAGRADHLGPAKRYSGYSSGQMFREAAADCRRVQGPDGAC